MSLVLSRSLALSLAPSLALSLAPSLALWLAPSLSLIVVFLFLLPLANAPLDWLSIGLTRGLLRTGLALGGTWRIALISLLDLALAAVLMFALVALTVALVAAANWAALAGGGVPILPIAPLLDGLTADPWAAEFAWIWLMLFSTLLPSLLHLFAGLASLAVTCMLWVCDSTVAAKAFVLGETAADRTKDTMFTLWYPGRRCRRLHRAGWPGRGDAAWLAGGRRRGRLVRRPAAPRRPRNRRAVPRRIGEAALSLVTSPL